jgi:hypothetical protein
MLLCPFIIIVFISHWQVAVSSLLTAVLTPTGVAALAAGVASGENTYYRDITFRVILYLYIFEYKRAKFNVLVQV